MTSLSCGSLIHRQRGLGQPRSEHVRLPYQPQHFSASDYATPTYPYRESAPTISPLLTIVMCSTSADPVISMACTTISHETFALFVDGLLDGETHHSVLCHIGTCDECFELIDGFVDLPNMERLEARMNRIKQESLPQS